MGAFCPLFWPNHVNWLLYYEYQLLIIGKKDRTQTQENTTRSLFRHHLHCNNVVNFSRSFIFATKELNTCFSPQSEGGWSEYRAQWAGQEVEPRSAGLGTQMAEYVLGTPPTNAHEKLVSAICVSILVFI